MADYDLRAWNPYWGVRECESLAHTDTPPDAAWSANVHLANNIIANVALCDACAAPLEGCAS